MRLPSLGRRRDSGAGQPPAPFVVGANRSGTTLLRMMLDAHPELTIPPETHFVPDVIDACEERGTTPEQLVEVMTSHREWGDFGLGADEVLERLRALDALTPGEALRAFYRLYAERAGKPRWGEKTPGYATSMIQIQKALPEAHFVHLIRDGRDVALSAMDRAKKPITAGQVAKRWKRRITKARRQSRRVKHYREARYEDLVRDTEPTLRSICEFVDLPWDPAMLEYHERASDRLREMARELPARGNRPQLEQDHRLKIHALTTEPPKSDRIDRWREQMSEEDRVAFERIAGDLLDELGYATVEPVGAART
jgi:Sulfotransferase family